MHFPKMRSSSRFLINLSETNTSNLNLFFPFSSSDRSPRNCVSTLLQSRSIFSTTQLHDSWMDKIKGAFTGKKSSSEGTEISSESFTLLRTPHFPSLKVVFLQLHDNISKFMTQFNYLSVYLSQGLLMN